MKSKKRKMDIVKLKDDLQEARNFIHSNTCGEDHGDWCLAIRMVIIKIEEREIC